MGALCGIVAAGAGLAAAEAAGLAARPEATPLVAVGGEVIDATPRPVKELAVSVLGTADKAVLLAGMALALAGAAALLGVLALRRPGAAGAGVAVFTAIGAAAALDRPDSGALDAVPSLLGGGAAVVVLWLLVARAPEPTHGQEPREAAESAAVEAPAGPGARGAGTNRRRFVAAAGAVATVSAVGGTGARWYAASAAGRGPSSARFTLPEPASPAPPLPEGAELDIAGLDPFFTPNEDFYRIDTVLSVPRIAASEWRLRLHGRGAAEREYTIADLLNRADLIERDITLACVSNPVGGTYVGNARWIGVPLAGLLEEAGVRPPGEGGPADQLVSRSEDGMTIGTPVADVMDGRDAMLALGMNGEPLPQRHGFPVRMVVPGLYGYVSACKWLVELELTTFEDYDPYWVPRGWAEKAPVKTQSRIDTPGDGANVSAGTVPVAGVAWAQHRGIEAVEVRVDDGEWQRARLSAEDTADTWRQWVLEWDAEPGEHRISVRARDREGGVQTSRESPTSPDGATGHHGVAVTVTP
ncbi:DMSO/TMAO reductase YedYZ molybdopterin-dependent catalytic subunit [Haloactinospora alba]|uniref:DMSO/TMAO reductase YedYZ molybdopterin-dependent catalytic subunit n=1 Tax=Haloactinospora alba TaxID=405555 RepID=A0A543NJF0_9ACTN|nr:DMSO/TMAO reductase YedYZ molybdopterin-dependent catalytic subunit [Haloactinospora alba]